LATSSYEDGPKISLASTLCVPNLGRRVMAERLTRPDLSQLIHLVHEKVARFRPHANESEEMFEFRIKNWRDLLQKLQQIFEEEGR